ncbi:MAG: YihY/virulence factor BrkB family protein [Candidatus Dormiibacterota bacterium]
MLIAYGESDASNYAAALAFAAFLAMFPVILGVLSIIGLAIRDPETEVRFQDLLLQVFPVGAQEQMQSAIHGVRQSAGWIGLLSIGGLLWTASGTYSTMEFALTKIFGTRKRGLVRKRLMGFATMVVLVAALGATVAANSLAGSVSSYVPYAWVLSLVAGAAVMVVLLVLVYRFVPNRTFALREVVPGALLAGVLIEAVSLVFPLYAHFAGRFNTYGAQFGLFLLLATWLYLLSQLLLLGAVYNRFRLEEPALNPVIASPPDDAKRTKVPVDLIKRKKGESQGRQSTGGKPQ